MAFKKEFDVKSFLPKQEENKTIKKIKRGAFAFKCFIRLSILVGATAYYGHLLYQKQHYDMAMSDALTHDYDLIGEAGKKLGNIIAEPFLALLGKAEGSSYKFYLDNKGFATGYGYNPTQNDEAYNKAILKFAEVDPDTIDTIVKVSGKYKNVQLKEVPSEISRINFSEKQIKKMAIFAKRSYEEDFLIVFKEKMDDKHFSDKKQKILINRYQMLTDEQKAVLIHMTYKVGQPGLAHYNTFFNDLINYLNNPTLQTQEKVANDFVYHYKLNGKILVDKRVDDIHHDLFMKSNHNEQIALTSENSVLIKDNNKNDSIKSVPNQKLVDNNTKLDSSSKVNEKQKEFLQYKKANDELQDELKQKLTFNHFYNTLKEAVVEHKKYKSEHPEDNITTATSDEQQDENESNINQNNNYTTYYTTSNTDNSDSDDTDDNSNDDDEQVTIQVTKIIKMTR